MKEKKEKMYLVLLDSNVDGDLYCDVIPCKTLKGARKALKEAKEFALKNSRFSVFDEEEVKDFIEEDTPNRFLINDDSDDFYEDYKIVRKEVRS
jgi:hypothetical protein